MGLYDNQYRGLAGYMPHMVNYNDNPNGLFGMAIGMAKGMLFPNARDLARPGMSQYDYYNIKQQTAIRGKISSRYSGYNPAALMGMSSTLSALGVSNPAQYLVNPGGDPTFLGKSISRLFNTFIGKAGLASAQMGSFENITRDITKGMVFNGSFDRYGLGFSSGQSRDVVRELMHRTYADTGLTKKRSRFTGGDIIDILQLGRDYGTLIGTDIPGMTKRTMNLSKLIGKSMNTFGTASKEDALRSILDITGGDISLQDTSKLESTLTKVKDLSRSANMSVRLLKEVLIRGQEVAKSLDMSGGVGTSITLKTLKSIENYTNIKGASLGTLGKRAVQMNLGDTQSKLLASTPFGLGASVLGAFASEGMDTSGILSDMQGKLIGAGNYQAYKDKLVAHLKSTGMPTVSAKRQAESLLRVKRDEGRQLFLEKTSSEGLTDLTYNVFLDSLNEENVDNLKEFREGKKLTSTEFKHLQTRLVDLAQQGGYFQGAKPGELAKILTRRQRDIKKVRKVATARLRAEALANVKETYMERQTQGERNPLARFVSGLARGERASALLELLPQGANTWDITEEDLEEGGELGLKRKLSRSISEFGTIKNGETLYQASKNIFGAGVVQSKKDAKLLINLKEVKARKASPGILKLVKSKRGVPVTLYDVFKDISLTKNNLENIMGQIRTADPKSYNLIMKEVRKAQRAGVPKMNFSALTIKDKAALLKKYHVSSIADIPEETGEDAHRKDFFSYKDKEEYVAATKEKSLDAIKTMKKRLAQKEKETALNAKHSAFMAPTEILSLSDKVTPTPSILDNVKDINIDSLEKRAVLEGTVGAVVSAIPEVKNKAQIAMYLKSLKKRGYKGDKYDKIKLPARLTPKGIVDTASFISSSTSMDTLYGVLKAGYDPKKLQKVSDKFSNVTLDQTIAIENAAQKETSSRIFKDAGLSSDGKKVGTTMDDVYKLIRGALERGLDVKFKGR